MSLLDVNRSVVAIIDLQGKLMDMIYRPSMVVNATIRLLKLAELFKVPVVLTEQYPKGLGKTHSQVWSAFEELTVEKRFLDKTSFGCCGDKGFEEALQELCPDKTSSPRQVVVAGIEAHICVMQTAIELLRTDNQVYLCWEAISGRGEEYRKHALERMQQAGGIITNHESVGFEWARDKSHSCFKAMSQLFKDGQP